MNVRFLKPGEKEDLAEFVGKHPCGSIEQCWEWGLLQTTISGRDAFYVLGVFKKEKLIASMLVIRQHMGRSKHWLWCPRGPLLPKKDGGSAWRLLEEKCREIAKKEADVYLRVEPGATMDDKWPVEGKISKEQYLPEHTLMIDLTDSLETIRKKMAQKGRYHIKKSEKAGVYVLKSDLLDFEEFYSVLVDTAERDGFHVHEKAFYQSFFDTLDGMAKLYVAYIDHELIAGLMLTEFGDTATYYYGASSNKHRSAYAPYALQWFAIQEAKKAGFKKYDFLGIAPDGEPKHTLAGVTQFKTRFGGEKVQYRKAQVFVYRPFWYRLMGLAKLLRK